MDNKRLAVAKETLTTETERKIQKIKFCIISNFSYLWKVFYLCSYCNAHIIF